MATTRRRTTLSPVVTDTIVEAIRAGNYAKVAAAAAGIHRATYFAWMNRGERASELLSKGETVSDDERAFADFHDRVSQAEAEAEMAAVASVREAKQGWQAHMTYLERRFPSRWRRMDGIKGDVSHKRDEESIEDVWLRMAERQQPRPVQPSTPTL